MKRLQTRKHPATFTLQLKGKGPARLADIHGTLREVLWSYHESCKNVEEPYPFTFELTCTTSNYASLFEQIARDTVLDLRSRFYPYTIDWYAVTYRRKTEDYLLTFAMRSCDLRELVG